MWCENCQQDVPELPVEDGELVQCAYCGNQLDTLVEEEFASTPKQIDMDASSLLDESLIDLSAEIHRSSEALQDDTYLWTRNRCWIGD